MMLVKVAKALVWKTNIAFYLVTNFILRNSVDGFFQDVIFVGIASMMAVLSLAILGVAFYFLSMGVVSLLNHSWMDFISQTVLAFILAGAAYACERGVGYVILLQGDDTKDDDERVC